MGTSATPQGQRSERSVKIIYNCTIPILGYLLGLFAFLILIVTLALPKLLRSWAESQLTSVLVHTVEIENLSVDIFSGHLQLDGLRIRSKEDHSELVLVRQVNIDIDVLPLFKQELSLARLEIVAPVAHLVRTDDTHWNLPSIGKRNLSSSTQGSISITIHRAVLRDGSLTLEDRSISPTQTERMHGIQLTLSEVSPASSNPAKIHGSAKVTESGTILIEGSVISDFRAANLIVDLTNVSLAPVQNILHNDLGLQGRASSHLSITWPGEDQSSISISGTVRGQDIGLSSEGLLMGQAAAIVIPNLEITWPHRVAMDRLELTQPQMWIRRNEGGRFVGFKNRANQPPRPERAKRSRQSESTTATAWHIGTIVSRDGIVHLEDRSVTPMYSDVLQNLEMTLSDVRSAPNHPVRIAAQADIASGGALDLNGHAALLGSTPSASLKATIHRLVVPSTNSYLRQTVSHYTTNGTLTSAMDIQLNGNRLEIRSDVTLSDLSVEPVNNSTRQTVQEHIGLPLGFLIALLKDESGRIAVTLPISGPLSNPTFDWTHTIWASIRKAVVNLISLPIRSIGRLVMGDNPTDEVRIDPITFPPGSLTLNDKMERRLQHLAKLLHTTDRMALHITPILSATDLEALQRLSRESWPVPNVDTAETARHLLAVRRAYLVATRLAGLQGVPSTRLPVDLPKTDISERTQGRVDLKLQ